MDREVLFAQTLEKVKKVGRSQGGYIRREQVEENFAALNLDKLQLELVFDYLLKNNIGIDEPLDVEERLTDKERSYIQNYYDELEQLPKYSDGEKRAYTISAMAGEADARKKLIEAYLKDVADIARIYSGQGVFIEDLIGEGNVALTYGCGMLGSLESPDEAEGMLVKLVMDAMEEYIRDNADSAKIHKKALDNVNKIHEKAKELSESYGRKVTVEELVRDAGVSEKAVRDALRISGFQIENIERAMKEE